jgi:hypothetical protein
MFRISFYQTIRLIASLLALSSISACVEIEHVDLGEIKLISVTKIRPDQLPSFVANFPSYSVYNYALDVRFTFGPDANKTIEDYVTKHEGNVGVAASLCNNKSYDSSYELQYDPDIYNSVNAIIFGSNDHKNEYHIYIPPISVPLAGQQVFYYDLKKHPADVCFIVQGGTMIGGTIGSKTAIISASMIK